MKLSKARAEFVKRRLVQYGIPAEMIVTRAFGETRPVSKDESTLEGRRKNRRAEIYFDATKRKDEGEPTDSEAVKETPKPTVKKPAKKKKPLPPEEVEPSVKPKPTKKTTDKSAGPKPAATEEKPAPEAAAPAEPASDAFTPPAAEKPTASPAAPPNTEIRIK